VALVSTNLAVHDLNEDRIIHYGEEASAAGVNVIEVPAAPISTHYSLTELHPVLEPRGNSFIKHFGTQYQH